MVLGGIGECWVTGVLNKMFWVLRRTSCRVGGKRCLVL